MTRSRATPSFKGLRPASPKATAVAKASSRKRDTRCELILRQAIFSFGLRYRTVSARLPGKPDIVFLGSKVAVFCDGDFWHGRELATRIEKLERGHNAPYWVAKIEANVARDYRITRPLEDAGWLVLRFWETEIRADPAPVVRQIAQAVAERRSGRQSVENPR